MSKYKYRATEFQRVDWAAIASRIAGDRLVLAVDVAKEDFMASLLTSQREVLQTVKWRHPQDSRALVSSVAQLGASSVEAVLEPSGTYGDALRGLLRSAGMTVYRVSPKRVHDAAEVYDGVPSLHDAKSAYVIGRLHLEGVSRTWVEPTELSRTLKAQRNALTFYQERGQRASNRLEGLMARHWPEAPAVLGLGTASLLELLACYGDPVAVAADEIAAAQQLRHTGGRWLRDDKIEALLASAHTTVGVPCVAAERELVRTLAHELLAVRTECRRVERALMRQVGRDAALERQAAAVGAITAAVIRSALGDAHDYPDAASYAKAAGLNLKERSSGKHQGQLKITRRGPSVVRFYLYFAVLRWIARPGPAKDWYHAKVARDGGRKGKAITALMRKLIKALWHVGRGEVFDEARLFGTARPARAA